MSTKKKYKTCFQDDWLSNPKYSVRLEKGASDDVAKCKICSKTFSVAAMGVPIKNVRKFKYLLQL